MVMRCQLITTKPYENSEVCQRRFRELFTLIATQKTASKRMHPTLSYEGKCVGIQFRVALHLSIRECYAMFDMMLEQIPRNQFRFISSDPIL
jgi:hypothetical protein